MYVKDVKDGKRTYKQMSKKHVCMYFEPLINYSHYFTSSTPSTYIAFNAFKSV